MALLRARRVAGWDQCTFLPFRSASVRSPTDFLAISTVDEREILDAERREESTPLYEAEKAPTATAAEIMSAES